MIPGTWFVMGEIWAPRGALSARRHATALVRQRRPAAGQIYTPYATYAARKVESDRSDPGLPVAAFPPFLAAEPRRSSMPLSIRGAGIQATVQTNDLGGRALGFHRKNVDCKLQVDHTRNGAGSAWIIGGPAAWLQAGRHGQSHQRVSWISCFERDSYGRSSRLSVQYSMQQAFRPQLAGFRPLLPAR
jgi:hypothetical protein